MNAATPWAIQSAVQRIIISGVSWKTFDGLLYDQFGRRSPRFTYDRGQLEIMVTSGQHELLSESFALLVSTVAEELGIDAWNLGHTTFKRDDLAQGFEPDMCFYFHRPPRSRNTLEFDPAIDEPPDLVVEVDLSRSSLSRFPIFAGFGVPEVWRYRNSKTVIWSLRRGEYVESAASELLPPVIGEVLTRFLADRESMSPIEWVRSVRAWARENVEAIQPN
jgi:Uma2 family endonuclease